MTTMQIAMGLAIFIFAWGVFSLGYDDSEGKMP